VISFLAAFGLHVLDVSSLAAAAEVSLDVPAKLGPATRSTSVQGAPAGEISIFLSLGC